MTSRILLLLPLVMFSGLIPLNAQSLVAKNAVWKYLDNGIDQGTAWRTTSFNDQSWASGPSQLGYGDGDEATTVSYGPSQNNKYRTTYFRKNFNINSLSEVQQGATLDLMRDDGAVVYLNGNEVFRSNMPQGGISYTTRASSSVTGGSEVTYFQTTVPSTAFVQGNNTIAVEVHQVSNSSGDISFDLELIGVGTPASANIIRGPYLQKATTNSMVVRWRTDQATDSKVFYGFSAGVLNLSKTNAGSTTEHEVEITGLNPATTYYFTVGNSGGQFQTGSTAQYFKTSPLTGSDGNFRMWVLGDGGMANANARSVRDAYYSYNGNTHTDAVLMLGDNAYNSGTDAEYQAAVFENMYENMLRKSVLWSCPGNHEYYSGADADTQTGAYYDIFTFPKNGEAGGLASGTEAYYSFDYGNVHIISLDSYGSDRSANGPMISWLANDLANTTQEWIIAIFHHPPYSKGSHNSDTEYQMVEMRQNALPILEAAGVDLVLSGHSHSYERSHLIQGHYGTSPSFNDCTMLVDGGSGRENGDGAYIKDTNDVFADEGAVYVVAGSSGKISGGSLDHPVMYASINQLGSLVLDVNGPKLDVKFLNNIGQVADYFTIKKEENLALDEDGDGYDNSIECPNGHPCTDTDGDCTPDYLDLDSDGDGINDQTDACRTDQGPAFNYGCPESNVEPDAQYDYFTTSSNTPLGGSVLLNDSDPNPGDNLTVTPTPITNVSNGVLNLNSSGAFGYTPYTDFVGSDYFEYEVCDDGTPKKCDQASVYITVDNGPNTPPVANDDTYSTDMNTTATGNVLSNDTDAEFNGLVLNTNAISGPSNGNLILYSSGSFNYTPFNGFVGTDNFVYEVCDDGNPSYCDQASVTITVNPGQNNPPLANDDLSETSMNVTVGGNVLTNDSDPDNDALILNTTPINPPSNGNVTLYSNGSCVYAPNTGYTGTDSFIYEVCDNGNPVLCDQAVVMIHIAGENQAPIAQNDSGNALSGTSFFINVLNNDSDPDGDLLTVGNGAIQGPYHGTVSLEGPGVYDYVSTTGYSGTDSFVYEVCDNGSPSLCAQATVYITVTTGGNDPPIAQDDVNSTVVNTPVGGNTMDNDSDPNGDGLNMSSTAIVAPSYGVVNLFNNGGYAYYPASDFIGTDSFVYQVCDDGTPVLCAQATVYITVSLTQNNPPVANDDNYSTTMNNGVTQNALDNDSDPDNDGIFLTTTPVTNVSNGTLVLYGNGYFSYTPNNNYIGIDNFVYEICDDGSPQACSNATVTITINSPSNDPPVAQDDLYNTSLNISVSANLLGNDSDPNGDNLVLNTTALQSPGNGSVLLYTNGTFNYTPNFNYSGVDSFIYQVCDDAPVPACSQALVYINITGSANNAPTAEDDLYSTYVATPVQGNILTNDSDPDGENLLVNTSPVQAPSSGSLSLAANGNFTYIPNAGYVGIDSFVYEVCDNNVNPLCDQAVVSIVVSSPDNAAPIANDDNYSIEKNNALSGNLLANDSDPDGDNYAVTTSPIMAPANGSLLLYANGGCSYTPNAEYVGNDSFIYQVCDDGSPSLCSEATVYIVVYENTNTPPIANDDSYILTVNTTYYDEVHLNDSDPDGDDLSLVTTPVAGPQNGTLTLYSTGLFAYTPNTNYSGTDSFVYQICDNGSPVACDQAVVELLINSLNNNLPPEATNDYKTTSYNVGFYVNVLSNDSDPNGDNLFTTATLVTPPSNGSAAMNGNGFYTYTPNSGYVGTDSFEYEVCDDGTPVLCDNAVVYVTMTSNNAAPIANNDSYSTVYEGLVDENVLVNDTDPDGNALTVNLNLVVLPSDGIVDMAANGDFTYTPDIAFYGQDNFVYRVCDDGAPSLCTDATVFITVTAPENTAPQAVDDYFSGDRNTSITGNALLNDSDADGDNLIGGGLAAAANNGTVSIDAAGNFSYTPNLNFVGVDFFTYRVCDDGIPSLCDQAVVTITVLNTANLAPIAVDDSRSTSYNVGFSKNLLSNDSDPDGDDLTLNTSPQNGPFNGTATLSANGYVTYTPESGFVGQDSLTYEVCDNGSPILCSTAVLRITMTSNNNPPLAVNDNYSAYPEITLSGNLLSNDSDPDNNSLSLATSPLQAPTKGQLSLFPSGYFEYTANAGSSGTDFFVYSVCDNGAPSMCDEATVTITINVLNNPPVALEDTVYTLVDVAVSGNVLDNDSDPDGNLLSVTTSPMSGPANGSLSLAANGSFTYTPATGFIGEDLFVYEVCDNGSPIYCAIASVTIHIEQVQNEPPNAVDDNFNINEDGTLNAEVLLNDSDPDADQLSVNQTPITAPVNGTLILNTDGTFTYKPSNNFNGTDSFVYEVCDDSPDVNCSTATAYINIFAVNDAPSTAPDEITVPQNTTITFDLLANDSDIDGNIDPTSVILFTQPPSNQGTASINPDGTLLFVPTAGFSGTIDPFFYQACDDGTPLPIKCNIGFINITVIEVNMPPIAVDDNYTVFEDTDYSGNLLVNDNDPDNDPLTLSTTPVQAPGGLVVLQPNGDFTYSPFPETWGTDSFSYEVCDNNGACDTAVVYIIVDSVNDPPEAHDETIYGNEDEVATGNVLPNDFDVEGDLLIVTTTPLSGPSIGTLVLNSDGTFYYTPPPGFSGNDEFDYEVCDNGVPSYCDTATVFIIINSINDAPIAVADYFTTDVNVTLNGNLLTNDTDPENDNLAVKSAPIVAPANGTVVLYPNGDFEYVPATNFSGNDSFVYQVCDNGSPGLCSTASVFITVIAGNQPPVAVDDSYSIMESEPLTANVLDNDSDPEGGQLTVTTVPVAAPNNGSLILNPDGTFTYTPTAGYFGTDSFVYEVCDDGSPVACSHGTVTISVADCPVAEFTVPTICEDETILFVAEDQGPLATYSWDFGLDASPRFSSSRVSFVEFSVAGVRSIFLTVTMNGCVVTTEKIITVHARPYIDPGPDVVICKGDSAILGGLPTGPAGAIYFWSPSIGLSANDVANPKASPPSTTTYTLFVTLGSCTEVENVTVTVKDIPQSNAGQNTFVCEGDSVQIGSWQGPVAGVTYLWSPASSLDNPNIHNPIAKPSITTIYTLTTSINGCENTDEVEVSVAPAPQSDAGEDVVTCFQTGGSSIQLGNPANEQGLLYQWSPSTYLDNPNSPNPISSTPVNMTYTMTAIKNGCFLTDEIEIVIGNCSTPPIAVADEVSGMEDGFMFFNVLSNDYSPGGFNISFNSLLVLPNDGIIDYSDVNGNLRYLPNPNFNGMDSFSYEICDDNNPIQCATTTVTLTVAPVNDAPTALPDGVETPMNANVDGNVLSNDYDIDGDELYINTTPVAAPLNGTLVLNSNGDYFYEPNLGFEGIDHFEYEVCDNGTPVLCQQEIMTIVVGDCVELELFAFLQGPFVMAADSMQTILNTGRRLLPGQSPINTLVVPTPAGQPYSGAPWLYQGTEGANYDDDSYAPTVVDWVLVSLRTGMEKSTEILSVAGLLHSDGHIEFDEPCFRTIDPFASYYIVIEHRSHVGIMSSGPVSLTNRILRHDFRIQDSYRNPTSYGQWEIAPSRFVMIAGDGDQASDVISYDVNGQDKVLWSSGNGVFDKYLPADFNMDGDISGADKVMWNVNNGLSSRVPK